MEEGFAPDLEPLVAAGGSISTPLIWGRVLRQPRKPTFFHLSTPRTPQADAVMVIEA